MKETIPHRKIISTAQAHLMKVMDRAQKGYQVKKATPPVPDLPASKSLDLGLSKTLQNIRQRGDD